MADGQRLDALPVDRVDEGSRFGAGGCDAMEVGDVALGHFVSGEVAVGQAEAANLVLLDGLSFRSVVSDSSVFHEHGPSLLPCESEPLHVDHILVRRDAIVLGQSRETKAFCSQK